MKGEAGYDIVVKKNNSQILSGANGDYYYLIHKDGSVKFASQILPEYSPDEKNFFCFYEYDDCDMEIYGCENGKISKVYSHFEKQSIITDFRWVGNDKLEISLVVYAYGSDKTRQKKIALIKTDAGWSKR